MQFSFELLESLDRFDNHEEEWNDLTIVLGCKFLFFRMNVLHAINLHLCVDTIKVLTEEMN